MRKIIAAVLSASLLSTSLPAFSQSNNQTVCEQTDGYTIGFFNGVQNQWGDACDSMRALAKEKYETKFSLPQGQTVRYELYYNQTKGMRDFVEVYEQLVLQQNELLKNRWETMPEILDGYSGGKSFTGSLIIAVAGLAEAFTSFSNYLKVEIPKPIAKHFGVPNLASLIIGNETEALWQTQTEQRQRINTTISEGRKLVMVAHSQGNLFVHEAYKSALKITNPESVKVIHVASASAILHGPHVLSDDDLVIYALRLPYTISTIPISTPNYYIRKNLGSGDILGHSFQNVYMHSALPLKAVINQNIVQALTTIQAPVRTAQPGLFTVTLEWNGSGDVDLHTYEPNGNKVYFGAKQGRSGRLDVDNTIKDGPEHFYADCSADKVMTGEYRIGVANYAGATGKTATVQVASWSGGVLSTNSVALGEPTKTDTGYQLLTVNVARDESTGKVTVSSVSPNQH